MSAKLHRQAEHLMADAEMLTVGGRVDEAATRWLEAARLEAEVFAQIPEDRPKTRGIIAVSTVALYRRAGALSEAIHAAYGYLATGGIPAEWQAELEDLVDRARQERQALVAGRTLGAESLVISLRGGSIGTGLAPLDLVARELLQMEKCTLRVGEWLSGKRFRTHGPAARDVAQLVNPVIGDPVSGSFRFQLRFEAPVQPALPGLEREPLLTPDSLAATLFEILDAIAHDTADSLSSRIEDTDYRTAFLKLVRSLAPDGRQFDEIEFQRSGGRSNASVVLDVATRDAVQRQLADVQQLQDPADSDLKDQFSGILRALDLDKGTLALSEGSVVKQRKNCKAARGAVLDDIAPPLMNRPVIVTGQWTPKRKTFIIQDIYEDVSNLESNAADDGTLVTT
jgi:hypothetical protein